MNRTPDLWDEYAETRADEAAILGALEKVRAAWSAATPNARERVRREGHIERLRATVERPQIGDADE